MRSERALRREIPAIAVMADTVSHAVRAMYEEHPYPRWLALDTEPPFPLSEWIARELPAAPRLATPHPVRILVAGCGTGRDAIWLASNIAGAQVLADLSLRAR